LRKMGRKAGKKRRKKQDNWKNQGKKKKGLGIKTKRGNQGRSENWTEPTGKKGTTISKETGQTVKKKGDHSRELFKKDLWGGEIVDEQGPWRRP